jgi:hypothetical protein
MPGKKLGSYTYREVQITSTISPGLKLGHNLANMQQLNPHIHEVIAFTTWLSAKQILPKSVV